MNFVQLILLKKGTGQSLEMDYYLTRPTITDDFNGQAPILWFAYSVLKDY